MKILGGPKNKLNKRGKWNEWEKIMAPHNSFLKPLWVSIFALPNSSNRDELHAWGYHSKSRVWSSPCWLAMLWSRYEGACEATREFEPCLSLFRYRRTMSVWGSKGSPIGERFQGDLKIESSASVKEGGRVKCSVQKQVHAQAYDPIHKHNARDECVCSVGLDTLKMCTNSVKVIKDGVTSTCFQRDCEIRQANDRQLPSNFQVTSE